MSEKVFALSHIAPESKKSTVNLMLDALETDMPIGMAIPKRIATPAKRLGFKQVGTTSQEFGQEYIDKEVLADKKLFKALKDRGLI